MLIFNINLKSHDFRVNYSDMYGVVSSSANPLLIKQWWTELSQITLSTKLKYQIKTGKGIYTNILDWLRKASLKYNMWVKTERSWGTKSCDIREKTISLHTWWRRLRWEVLDLLGGLLCWKHKNRREIIG